MKAIRVSLNLSPGEMAARLNVPRQHVVAYESDESEPTLAVLLDYSRAVASLTLEQLVHDDQDLNLAAQRND